MYYCPSQLVLFSALLFTEITLNQAAQRIIESPKSIRVLRGTKGLMKCRVVDQVGAVQWTKNGFGLGSDRDLINYNSYKMVGSSARGEFNLKINPVGLSDGGDYRCTISGTAKEPGKVSDVVSLTVLVAPSEPMLLNIPSPLSVTEGRQTSVKCKVDQAKPAPQISWVISSNAEGSDIVRMLDKDNQNGGETLALDVDQDQYNISTVVSELRYIPRQLDDGKYVVCLVNHETLLSPSAGSTKLSVRYTPKVKISVNMSNPMQEGDSVTLTCNSVSKPNVDLIYVWRKEGIIIEGRTGKVFDLVVSKSDHGVDYECEVSNSVGKGKTSYTVKLTYGPTIVNQAKRYNVNEGDTVNLHCPVESNPPASIKWIRLNDPQTVLFIGENLTLHHIKSWQKGAYQCVAELKGFPSASSVTHVSINGPPHVSMSSLYEATHGQTVELVCQINGYPNPTNIWWSKDQIPISQAFNKRFQMRQLPQEDGLVSILKITDMEMSDFGVFNCSASNDKGTDFASSSLIRVDPFPLYYIIPCAVLLGVLVICLCLCIFCLNKRNCGSKRSTAHSDAHSDVQVKVEALDGSGIPLNNYPDMYTPVQNNHMGYGPDYMCIPEDNPDLDLLPPPYVHYPLTTNGGAVIYGDNLMPAGHMSSGHMVHMTYIGDNNYDDRIHENNNLNINGRPSSAEFVVQDENNRESPPLTSTFVPPKSHTLATDALLGKQASTHV